MGFFGKVFSRTVVLILLTAGAIYLASLHALEEQVYATTAERVERESLLVQRLLERSWTETGVSVDLSADLAADLDGSRLTVIAADGEVLFDSHREAEAMDNHLDREELSAPGVVVTRHSDTLEKDMLYCARPIDRGGERVGHVRVAQLVEEANTQIAVLNAAVRGSVLVAILVALVVAALMARQIMRPLEEIGDFVARVGRGETARRIPVLHGREFAHLGQTVNTMIDALEAKISRIQRDKVEREAILSAIADGLIALDVEQRLLFINGAGRRLLRAPAGRVKGRSIRELTDNEVLLDLLAESARESEPVHAETLLTDPEGNRRIGLSVVPLPGEEGRRRGSVLVLRDVTELRHLEGVRRDFVSNVSHELKTPLTAMRGYVDSILEDEDMSAEQRSAFLSKARKNTERLTAIVSDLLSLSRLESQERELSFEILDVSELVREVLEDNADLALSRKIRLESEERASDARVEADARALHMALTNLIGNAIQYSPQETGVVRVVIDASDEEVFIDVIDNGQGIPPEEQERVFERFYRVDKARSRRLGGTGLGLSIVRHVVAAHEGRVELESTPGAGSRFRVALPRNG